jgi:hypothetical protein
MFKRLTFATLGLLFFASCAKEFHNPYDPATPPDIWMPKSFRLDTLGTNALRLSWNQEEQHIDGFAIQKITNGQIKEILLPLDSLRYTDIQVVDTSLEEVCQELSYIVMARAGNNRSLDIGIEAIRLPFSTFAEAGSDQTILSNLTQVALAANAPATGETGTWSILSGVGGSFSNVNSPISTFTGNTCTNYLLRWTIQGNCSSDFDDVNISFQKANTLANAGTNITSSSPQVTLSANAPSTDEYGQWIIVSGLGGSFSNTNSPTSTFTGNLCSTYTLRWSIQSLCTTTSDDVVVSFNIQTSQAQAGSDQSPSGLSIFLNSNLPGINEIGSWSIVSGTGGDFSNANASNSQFTGLAGNTYQLRWTISGTCSTSSDDMVVTFPANPTGISFYSNSCNNLSGTSSLYYGINANSGTWGITASGFSGSCWVAPNPSNSGQLSNAIGTHYISFQQNFSSSGYVEFWFNTYYAGSPNIMPQVFIDDVQQNAPTIIAGQTTNGSWMKARTSVVNSGNHTIKIQFASSYYVLKVDEVECFQY